VAYHFVLCARQSDILFAREEGMPVGALFAEGQMSSPRATVARKSRQRGMILLSSFSTNVANFPYPLMIPTSTRLASRSNLVTYLSIENGGAFRSLLVGSPLKRGSGSQS